MTVREIQRFTIPTETQVRSLCWDGNTLIDWAAGGMRYSLDGSASRPNKSFYPYRFDRAIVVPNTGYTILYEVLGTKALILQEGQPIREVNRSYYCANAYEYPMAAFTLDNGTPVLVHCPEEYNKLEIEEVESGRRLTTRTSSAIDFFHSRLQLSPDGGYLISAGWVWHPLDAVQVFRIADVLENPALLDQYCSMEVGEDLLEIHSAAFNTNTSLLFTAERTDSAKPVPLIGEFDLSQGKTTFLTRLETEAGTLMPIGSEYAVGFFESPKLIQLSTGKVTLSWPELNTGKQSSSIIRHHDALPPLAIDPSAMRFAVAEKDRLTVIHLGCTI